MPTHSHWDQVKLRARELRKVQTPAEQALWSRLRKRALGGLKFRRQHPLGPYFADFYCAQHRLVVELDGDIHLGHVEQDRARTAQLEAYGYHLLRVRNEEVAADLEAVLTRIAAACGASALLPSSGEGREEVRPSEGEPLPG